MVAKPTVPSKAETGLAAGILALMIAAGLAIKGAALMLFTDLLSNYTDVIDPIGFIPSVGLVLLFAVLTATADFSR